MKWRWLALALAAVALSAASVEDDFEDEDEATIESEEEIVSVETIRPEDDVLYITPDANPDVFFAEHFDAPEEDVLDKKWIRSQAKKDGAEAEVAKYDGEWAVEAATKDPLAGDTGLVLKSKAKHSAVAAKLRRPFPFDEKPLIVQYELNFQNGQDCGGGYIKLLTHKKGMDLREFTDKTPYTIMFGPDKCGSDAKLHFIFRHVNPKNGSIEEKHCKKLDTKERAAFEEVFKDKRPHLYRLIINPDNTFEVSVDYKVVNHGTLLDDFNPPVNPPAEIDDPDDRKPEDWDEREKIPDPEAKKPDDWDESQPRTVLDEDAEMPDGWLEDEPETVADAEAERPEDWDDELDGEWEPPQVDNPKCAEAPGCGKWSKPVIDNPLYKGKWHAPLIDNPDYKGKWKPRKIANPDYFHDPEPFKMTAVGAVGIELWTMSDELYFDNVLIADDKALADAWAAETFDLKVQKLDVNEASAFRRILNYSNRNPWLYAVYVVLVGLPLVLIVTFCCSGDSASTAKAQANGKKEDAKKTDEPQPDDEPEEEEEEQEEEEAEEEEEEAEEEAEEEEEEEQVVKQRKTRSKRARKD